MSKYTESPLATFGDNRDTWRFVSIAFGFLLLISLAAHLGGPASAHAAADPGQHDQFSPDPQQDRKTLSIGGFTTIDGQPAFIIIDQGGKRLGALPMIAPEHLEQHQGQTVTQN